MKLNNWLLFMAVITCSLFFLPPWSYAGISQSERAALIALYNATDGDNWTNNTNWKQPPLESDGFGAYGTEGSWYGVSVNYDSSTELHLPYNQLSGSIPSELGNFSSLVALDLMGNQLSGSIPSELGNLSNLVELNIGDNRQLSGSIPSELGNLSSLEKLNLNGNQLSGSIPSELGNLSNLKSLLLQSDQLSGGIPSEFGNLSSLIVLYLDNNQLSGSIPSELGNLSNLESLWLEGNQLSGSIPSELGNLSNLKVLYLDDNQLSGSIPSELGNLSSLTVLYLGGNQLGGSIPSELGNLSNLERLVFASNEQLSGGIPSELGNLTNLVELNLRDSQLGGNIPSELGNLSNLKQLNLYLNQLQGAIPDTLKNLTQLDDNGGLNLAANSCLYVDESDDGSLQAFIDLKAGEGWEQGAQGNCEDASSGDSSCLDLLKMTKVSISGTNRVDSPMTITATASNECGGSVYYKFGIIPDYGTGYYDPSNWTSISDYTTSQSVVYTFTEAGSYIFTATANSTPSEPDEPKPMLGGCITIAESDGSSCLDLLKMINVSISGTNKVNSPMTITATASNECGGSVYYKFGIIPYYGTGYYDPSNWTSISDYTTSSSTVYTFTEAGSYIFTATANSTPSEPDEPKPMLGGCITITE